MGAPPRSPLLGPDPALGRAMPQNRPKGSIARAWTGRESIQQPHAPKFWCQGGGGCQHPHGTCLGCTDSNMPSLLCRPDLTVLLRFLHVPGGDVRLLHVRDAAHPEPLHTHLPGPRVSTRYVPASGASAGTHREAVTEELGRQKEILLVLIINNNNCY